MFCSALIAEWRWGKSRTHRGITIR